MRKIYILLMAVMLLCIGCQWKLTSTDETSEDLVAIERYDRIESLYLTTGDFSALQQMNTSYPQQTRTLIEDVLKIGRVNEPEINVKFLNFYQDTTLQALIASVEQQYADMDDVSSELNDAFARLRQMLPDVEMPQVYTQIGSLDQSIIVGNGMLGISLDKYLGRDFPLYLRPEYGYSDGQRRVMTREYIVPDCVGFYLLSLYPMTGEAEASQLNRDIHMGKIQWVVNRAMGRRVFNTLYTRTVGNYMKRHPKESVDQLLRNSNYREIR